MARGGRTYNRDSRGRFASGGGSGGGGKGSKGGGRQKVNKVPSKAGRPARRRKAKAAAAPTPANGVRPFQRKATASKAKPAKTSKSTVGRTAREMYRQDASQLRRRQREASMPRNRYTQDDRLKHAGRVALARDNLAYTTASLRGKKALDAFKKNERRASLQEGLRAKTARAEAATAAARRKTSREAKAAVAAGRAKAGKTIRGKVAAVARFLRGGKRR